MPPKPDRTLPVSSLTARPYAGDDDLRQMRALLMEARARTDDWRYWHVGELQFSFFMVACHLNPRDHVRLWHAPTGQLVGYALLGEDPAFDFQVLPEYEESGLAAAALAWAETSLAGLRQRDEAAWGHGLVAGSRQDHAERIAFLERHGFRRGEYAEVNMLRSLDQPISEPALPGGWQVRAVAEAGEAPSRAAIQREVWQPWTVGNVRDDDYARFMRLPGYERDLDLVTVTPDGTIAAYVNGWLDPVNRIGDFGPVGARLAYRRQGLTRAALLEGLRRMRAHGMERVCISTGDANTAARRLYESIGFQVVNRYHEYVKAR